MDRTISKTLRTKKFSIQISFCFSYFSGLLCCETFFRLSGCFLNQNSSCNKAVSVQKMMILRKCFKTRKRENWTAEFIIARCHEFYREYCQSSEKRKNLNVNSENSDVNFLHNIICIARPSRILMDFISDVYFKPA